MAQKLAFRSFRLSSRYRQSCSEVGSSKSDILGGGDDYFVRTRGFGSSHESRGTSRDSPSDNDARHLWATREGAVACFGSLDLALQNTAPSFVDPSS